MPYSRTFRLEFEIAFVYLKSASSNLSNCEISQKEKQKCLNLRPKFKKLLSYLKSVPSNLSNRKI